MRSRELAERTTTRIPRELQLAGTAAGSRSRACPSGRAPNRRRPSGFAATPSTPPPAITSNGANSSAASDRRRGTSESAPGVESVDGAARHDVVSPSSGTFRAIRVGAAAAGGRRCVCVSPRPPVDVSSTASRISTAVRASSTDRVVTRGRARASYAVKRSPDTAMKPANSPRLVATATSSAACRHSVLEFATDGAREKIRKPIKKCMSRIRCGEFPEGEPMLTDRLPVGVRRHSSVRRTLTQKTGLSSTGATLQHVQEYRHHAPGRRLNARLVRGELGGAVRRLNQQAGERLWVGGVTLPRALADLGLFRRLSRVRRGAASRARGPGSDRRVRVHRASRARGPGPFRLRPTASGPTRRRSAAPSGSHPCSSRTVRRPAGRSPPRP